MIIPSIPATWWISLAFVVFWEERPEHLSAGRFVKLGWLIVNSSFGSRVYTTIQGNIYYFLGGGFFQFPDVGPFKSRADGCVQDMLDTDYEKRVTLPEVRRRLRAYLEGDAEDGLNTMLNKMLCCSWVNFRDMTLTTTAATRKSFIPFTLENYRSGLVNELSHQFLKRPTSFAVNLRVWKLSK